MTSNSALKIRDDFVVHPICGELPEDKTAQQDFYNALMQCICVIGINTSGMIDAVLQGKPCIAYMADKYDSTQRQATHFKQMLDADILELAHTPEEAVKLIENLARGGDKRWEQRRKFVKEFIRPRGLDRMAGQLAANAIKKIAKR